MSMNVNVHPSYREGGGWKRVKIELNGKGEGSCIGIHLEDEVGFYDVHLHYGDEIHKERFVKMFKEAISNIKIEEVTSDGEEEHRLDK
jgi:hypothetical protein